MQTIPHEKSFDSTLQLLRDPYCFITRKRKELGSDVFQIRLLSKPVLCMTGEAAARLFYNDKFFIHRETYPDRISEEQVKDLTHQVQEQLLIHAKKWENKKGHIKLYEEFKKVLFEGICLWLGIPLNAKRLSRHSKDVAMMYEDEASPHKYIQLRLARSRTEKWLMKYADESLSISFIRHLMEVSVYLSKAIHALHTQPEARRYLLDGEDEQLDHFIQEVIRFYPFFPSQMAEVKEDFEWEGLSFKKGTRAMFDLYGTNRDPRLWNDPDKFLPARFVNSKPNPLFPEKFATTTLMKMVLKFFTEGMDYNLPLQSMDQEFSKPPALIKSGLLIKDVEINSEYWRPGPEYTGFMNWRTPSGNQDSWDSK